MHVLAIVTALLLGASDETAVRQAALQSWFNQIHGGTGVAERRRPVLVNKMTISPTLRSLDVRVSSPANSEPRAKLDALKRTSIVADLIERSRRAGQVSSVPAQFVTGTTLNSDCGPQFDRQRYSDAIAISRPGYSGDRKEALIYLESYGYARAYHLRRTDSGWEADWYVELWACG